MVKTFVDWLIEKDENLTEIFGFGKQPEMVPLTRAPATAPAMDMKSQLKAAFAGPPYSIDSHLLDAVADAQMGRGDMATALQAIQNTKGYAHRAVVQQFLTKQGAFADKMGDLRRQQQQSAADFASGSGSFR